MLLAFTFPCDLPSCFLNYSSITTFFVSDNPFVSFRPIMYGLHTVADVNKHTITSSGWLNLWLNIFMAKYII